MKDVLGKVTTVMVDRSVGDGSSPKVVYFKEKSGKYVQDKSVDITKENNDSFEIIFQFDIDGDGSIRDLKVTGKSFQPSKTNKLIKGNGKTETLEGTKKNDDIIGDSAANTLKGKYGDDILRGGKSKNSIFGGDGNDYLIGGIENDSLLGGKGADVFSISKGIDVVEDFNLKDGDRIALGANVKFDLVDYQAAEQVSGTLVVVESDQQLLLKGVSLNEFTLAIDNSIVTT